jgi:type VI secretion system protein
VRLILTLAGGGSGGASAMRTITTGSLSIGRGPGNDWVLPDPTRFLSKEHCVIASEGGSFILTDLSSNGIYINDEDRATTRDSRVPLKNGDKLRLGEYVINVSEVDDASGLGAPATGNTSDQDRFGSSSISESGGALEADPLDDAFEGIANPSFSHPIQYPQNDLSREDPFDQAGRNRRPTFDDDLFRGIVPSNQWTGAPKSDHAPATSQAVPPQRLTPVNADIDFDALLGDLILPGSQSKTTVDSSPQLPTDPPTTELHRPPATSAVSASQIKPRAAPPASPEAAKGDAGTGNFGNALAAFLEGAGLPADLLHDSDDEQVLRSAGAVFRTLVEGVREILLSRAAIKSEMRIAQTMIRAHGNNALKFSMNADDAVVALLSARRQGYMDALPAAREALDDIKAHELAVMAGVRTALTSLLRRFDPDAVEARLGKAGLGSVMSGGRKARYWEEFRQIYATIAEEAEDDFQAVFGRSFADAYSARTRKD